MAKFRPRQFRFVGHVKNEDEEKKNPRDNGKIGQEKRQKKKKETRYLMN